MIKSSNPGGGGGGGGVGIVNIVHVSLEQSLLIERCHRQDELPFAVLSLVVMLVDKVHHTQPLEAPVQLKISKISKNSII